MTDLHVHTLIALQYPWLSHPDCQSTGQCIFRTSWMADELQDYVAVMACLWLSLPKRPSFVEGRMGEWKKRAQAVR